MTIRLSMGARVLRKRILGVGLVLLALVSAALFAAPRSFATGGDEGGIGGTGIFFGQVTAFSSIIMNGERIALPQSVGVRTLSGLPQPTVLLPGDTVFLTAELTGDGPVASQIVRFFPIVGPVDWSQSSRQLLSIMGTRVRIGGSVFTDPDGLMIDWSALPRDAVFAVNGIWENENIIATRLVVFPAGTSAAISGMVVDAGGVRRIGGTTVAQVDAETGDFATLIGTSGEGGLVAASVLSGLDRYAPFDGPARLSASAVLSPDPVGPGFHLSGFGIPMDPSSPVPRTTGQLQVFKGTYDARFLITEAQ
ncbi:MAG: hypothetical protein AAF739_16805 [Pseudomonadota bacterium]